MRRNAEWTEDDILYPLKQSEFLVIDDIGADKASEFSVRVLADLINPGTTAQSGAPSSRRT